MKFEPIIGPTSYSEEWYACRILDRDRKIPVYFGASEAAALCGISKYQSTYELYLHKVGLLVDTDEEDGPDSDHKQWGHAFEGVNLLEYARRNKVTIAPNQPMLIHPEYQYLSATPDAMAWRESMAEWWPVDAKCTNWLRLAKEFGEEWSDDVPVDILMQAQQQMLVTGTKVQHTPVIVPGRTLKQKVFVIHRNEKLCNGIIEAGRDMARRVLDGDPPDPDFAMPGMADVMKRVFKLNPDEICWMGEEVNDWWRTYQSLGTQMEAFKKEREELKARILHRMGDAAVGRFPDGDVELVRQVRHRAAYEVKATDYTVLIQKKVK